MYVASHLYNDLDIQYFNMIMHRILASKILECMEIFSQTLNNLLCHVSILYTQMSS